MLEMLHAEPFCYYNLTLQFLSSKYSSLRMGVKSPPPHMSVIVAPMEMLPHEVSDATDHEEAVNGAEDDSPYGSADDAGVPGDASRSDAGEKGSEACNDSNAEGEGKCPRKIGKKALCVICSEEAIRSWAVRYFIRSIWCASEP